MKEIWKKIAEKKEILIDYGTYIKSQHRLYRKKRI